MAKKKRTTKAKTKTKAALKAAPRDELVGIFEDNVSDCDFSASSYFDDPIPESAPQEDVPPHTDDDVDTHVKLLALPAPDAEKAENVYDQMQETAEFKLQLQPRSAAAPYLYEDFKPISETDGDVETTTQDLHLLNAALAGCHQMLPKVQTVKAFCDVSKTLCQLLETRRAVKKLPYGSPRASAGYGRVFEDAE